MRNSCFLFGHSDAPSDLLPHILAAVEHHYQAYGVRSFVVGHRGNFDHLAAQALRALKSMHPDVTLMLLIAYHPAERTQSLPQGFDCSLYPDGMEKTPRRLAILRANQYAIAHCHAAVCYVHHTLTNTAQLLEQAHKRGISIQNLAAAGNKNPPTCSMSGE
ncbi:MAG: hypothetical protein IJP04_13715 [Clostridia bacterium]|nr:hypothetical protein [Clostridia bacterium]